MDELERMLMQHPRTGLLNALTRVGPAQSSDQADLAEMIEAITTVIRGGDAVLAGNDDDILVLLRGVHDLPVAITVARKICAAAEVVAPACAGVTIVSHGESSESALMRARGALDMAREAGPGQVISSPLWP